MQTPAPWIEALGGDVLAGPDYADLRAFLTHEEQVHPVFPPAPQRLAALARTPPEAVRIVVLGQDPYHGAGQANGLAFSVAPPTRIPPSLRNIFRERHDDLGLPPPGHGDLGAWADRGVLLLNTVLTVREGAAGSHRKRGWERFTDHVLRTIQARRPLAVVLWGRPAQKKRDLLDPHHLVIESAHPSPLSARRGFYGSRPFSRIDTWFAERGEPPLDWSL